MLNLWTKREKKGVFAREFVDVFVPRKPCMRFCECHGTIFARSSSRRVKVSRIPPSAPEWMYPSRFSFDL